MGLTDDFRLWFIALYLFNVSVYLVSVIRFRARRSAVERKEGLLPAPGALVILTIPLVILVVGVGELPETWWAIRAAGVLIGLYNVAMQIWALRALDRFFIPGIGVYREHKMVTSGPFRYVRHPVYSAVTALQLAAALGTVNWLLLALWPLLAAAMRLVPIPREERMLREKFGEAYQAYADRTGSLFPRL